MFDDTQRTPEDAELETTQGLARLGVVHETTLPRSPYQNGKQESFWTQVEGRLLAMLDFTDCPDLTLHLLHLDTDGPVLALVVGSPPLSRYTGPDVGRPAPGSDALRLAFGMEEGRTQRKSDGTLVIEGRRFEVPGPADRCGIFDPGLSRSWA